MGFIIKLISFFLVCFLFGGGVFYALSAWNGGGAYDSVNAKPVLAAGSLAQEVSAANPWKKRCESDVSKGCELFQRIMMPESNVRLLEVAVGFPKNSKVRVGVVLPLGITVSSGIGLQVDEGALVQSPIDTCSQQGCLSMLQLEKDTLDSMLRGKYLNILFFDGSKKKITVRLSLQDFEKNAADLM